MRPPPALFRLLNPTKPVFTCPVCSYTGPFYDGFSTQITKLDSRCPGCGSVERTRIQWAAVEKLFSERDPSGMRALHFAPEALLRPRLTAMFASYETADLHMPQVDHHVDLLDLPFPDASFDFVMASHVLEHIKEDRKAIREIRRILRLGGVALLPVPTPVEKTIEYDAPNPDEDDHVRAPGLDYFDRYAEIFSRVEVLHPVDFPAEYQLYWRRSDGGPPAPAYMPICYV